jgi:hypothetical protein
VVASSQCGLTPTRIALAAGVVPEWYFCSVSKRRVKLVQIAPSGSALVGHVDWASLGDDPPRDLQVFAGATSREALRQRLRKEVETEVAAMLDAIRDFDAFDVIELMRLREIPVVPVVALMDGHDGNGAAIDLVSLIFLSLPDRMPRGRDRHSTEPHHAIDNLHTRAMRLLRLGTLMHTMASALASDPLARLASEYQTYLVGVRNFQYDSVQAEHETALFARPEIDVLLQEHLGFTFGDFTTVRSAIQARYSRVLTGLRDETGGIVMRCQDERRDPTEQEIRAFGNAMSASMFLPGERASFTTADIADESGLKPARVGAVLGAFSIGFGDDPDAAAAVASFLRGVNPLASRSLVRDAADRYLMTGQQIGTDSFRMIAESALKPDARAWERYKRARTDISETAAVAAVSRALQTPPAYRNLKYYAPRQGQSTTTLWAACSTPQAVGEQTECDGLFLVEDVAICVEVKGRSVSGQARRGDRTRLAREIKAIFGEGARQARRLEQLISDNHGLWVGDGSWLDLTGIREARSIVVGLDDFGPLTVALGDLKRAGMLGEGTLPWIASLHDLEVISKVTERPAELLLYLRRRADSGVADYYRGADELDLFMLFLNGGLYVEPDPDEVRLQHPFAAPPRTRAYKQHQRDARPTFVGTYTDPLDAWMYWTEGTSPYKVAKPALNTHPAAREIVDFLADGRKPGWLRFGADLLSLAGTAQKQLGHALHDMARKSRTDGGWHSLAIGYVGTWGYPLLFAGTKPHGWTRGEARDRLRAYMTAKKHQVKSDRSLGLLLDQHRDIICVIYMNDSPEDDPDLDALGEWIGLRPPGESQWPLPPYARRTTRRLRGQAKRKRRR